jgi:selenide,water dikinase
MGAGHRAARDAHLPVRARVIDARGADRVPGEIRLTRYSHGAGCACKLGSAELTQILRRLAPSADPALLVGHATSDDAAVYRLRDDLAIVVTADFFAPLVDDARTFGMIAAANALSDVYAMGGEPLLALNLVGWPRDELPFDMLGDVLEGGQMIVTEAGAVIAGGHSIDDREPKYGLAVVGFVAPDAIWTNAGAIAGDALVLTKPLGTGVIVTAAKQDRCPPVVLEAAIASMVRTNRDAMRVARASGGVHAATDVTGFGLLGHLLEMCRASRLSATLDVAAIPIMDGAAALAAAGAIPSGTRRNLDALAGEIDVGDGLDPVLLADAQTSGGLLLAVDPALVERMHASLRSDGVDAEVIGRFEAAGSPTIRLR